MARCGAPTTAQLEQCFYAAKALTVMNNDERWLTVAHGEMWRTNNCAVRAVLLHCWHLPSPVSHHNSLTAHMPTKSAYTENLAPPAREGIQHVHDRAAQPLGVHLVLLQVVDEDHRRGRSSFGPRQAKVQPHVFQCAGGVLGTQLPGCIRVCGVARTEHEGTRAQF
eukprot:1151148-Pelagomonas_calceolata.AAC.5